MAHRHGFKTQEEIEYAKKRLVSYLSSGFHRTKAMKALKISTTAYARHFANDSEVIKALKSAPKRSEKAV